MERADVGSQIGKIAQDILGYFNLSSGIPFPVSAQCKPPVRGGRGRFRGEASRLEGPSPCFRRTLGELQAAARRERDHLVAEVRVLIGLSVYPMPRRAWMTLACGSAWRASMTL